MNSWKPILAAITIFAAGFVTGGLTIGGFRPSPEFSQPTQQRSPRSPRPERPREGRLRDLSGKLESELRLTPAQRQRVEEIVRQAHERVKTVADEMGPLIHEEFKQMEQEILKELTDSQAIRFQELIQQRESKFKRGEGPFPGPPPPP